MTTACSNMSHILTWPASIRVTYDPPQWYVSHTTTAYVSHTTTACTEVKCTWHLWLISVSRDAYDSSSPSASHMTHMTHDRPHDMRYDSHLISCGLWWMSHISSDEWVTSLLMNEWYLLSWMSDMCCAWHIVWSVMSHVRSVMSHMRSVMSHVSHSLVVCDESYES